MTAKPGSTVTDQNSDLRRERSRSSGLLFILSAPSGAGKTTLCRKALERYPDLRYSVSFTTRPPRSDEQNGVDYHFISDEEFETGIRDLRWAEWAWVHGDYYGTSAEFIDDELAAGHDVLLDIDIQGTRQLLERYPDSITIFIMPPSLKILRRRLEKRSTESPEKIERRLKAAETEIGQKGLYRHVIVNDVLADAVDKLNKLIGDYRQRSKI